MRSQRNMRNRGRGHPIYNQRGRGGPRPMSSPQHDQNISFAKEVTSNSETTNEGSNKPNKKPVIGGPSIIPKCASDCLRELAPSFKTIMENKGSYFTATTDIGDGKQYKGYGPEPPLAAEASAESALISFLQLPSQTPGVDTTPWQIYASFAMFRLLREWREVEDRNYNAADIMMYNKFIEQTEGTSIKSVPISQRLVFPNSKPGAKENTSGNDTEAPTSEPATT